MDKFSEETSTNTEISGADSPDDININNVQIKLKSYMLTVGFEVNHPEAYVGGDRIYQSTMGMLFSI